MSQPNSVNLLGIAVLCALLATGIGLAPIVLQSNSARASAHNIITYQGRLSDDAGIVQDGQHTFDFRLFASEEGGAPLWSRGAAPIVVTDGLFTVDLAIDRVHLDGRALWLEITVDGQVLSPRQPLRPAPLAQSLNPGATIAGTDSSTPALSINQAATGAALHTQSQDTGLRATGNRFGIVAQQVDAGLGYGGHFSSSSGVGVFGRSSANPSGQNLYAPGVWGESEHGVGVLGAGTGAAATVGVLGRAATGTGVHGSSPGMGVFGSSPNHGVYGVTTGSTQGQGYGGYFSSATGIGVYGRSTASTSAQNQLAPGVWGHSDNGVAVYGTIGSSGGVAGYFDGPAYVAGNLIIGGSLVAGGSKAGYVVDIARNDSAQDLLPGHVVILTGVSEPVIGAIPVPTVSKTSTPAHRGVAGVVDRRYLLDEDGRPQATDGAIAPGDLFALVTLGAFATLRVDATFGAIEPGDLLVTSPTQGYAMRAADPVVGSIVGKALDYHAEGTGAIPVLVTLH